MGNPRAGILLSVLVTEWGALGFPFIPWEVVYPTPHFPGSSLIIERGIELNDLFHAEFQKQELAFFRFRNHQVMAIHHVSELWRLRNPPDSSTSCTSEGAREAVAVNG
jgi:hypothetical protein